VSGDHRGTTNHRVDLLFDSGFKRYKNTQIFMKSDTAILSPSISQNVQGKYWFDIREAILKKIRENKNVDFSLVFIRIVPNIFIFIKTSELKVLMTEFSKKERDNHKVWSFEVDRDFRRIFNKKSMDDFLLVKTTSESEVVSLLVQL